MSIFPTIPEPLCGVAHETNNKSIEKIDKIFFILDTILPEGHRYLPIFMYVLENNNIKLIKRFELPAKIAYADLNDSGDEMAIAYTLQERFDTRRNPGDTRTHPRRRAEVNTAHNSHNQLDTCKTYPPPTR